VVFATGDGDLPGRSNGQTNAVILCKPYDSTSLADCLSRARAPAPGAGTAREDASDGSTLVADEEG
jgi:hypothetical protein